MQLRVPRSISMRCLWIPFLAFSLLIGPSASLAEPTQTVNPRSIETGIFVGGNIFGDQIELGNSPFDDQIPSEAFLFGLRANYPLWSHIAPKSSVNPSYE